MECVRRRAARSLRVFSLFVPNWFAEMTSRVSPRHAAHTAGDATAFHLLKP